MILQLSIQCVENADGCPGVIVYGDETFPIISPQQVRFIPFSLQWIVKIAANIWSLVTRLKVFNNFSVLHTVQYCFVFSYGQAVKEGTLTGDAQGSYR